MISVISLAADWIHPSEPPVHGRGIGFEFLAQTDGDCILELGPAHFQDGIEFYAFPGKSLFQGFQAFVKIFQQEKYRQFSGGRDHIVGGLAPVHIIIGMDEGIIAFFASQNLDGDVSNHFIGIHVERGTGSALDGVQDELVQVFPFQELIAGCHDGVCCSRLQCASPPIGHRTGFLDVSQASDHGRMSGLPGNMEIFMSTQRLHSIIGVPGDVFLTDGITFRTFEFLLTHCLFPPWKSFYGPIINLFTEQSSTIFK